MAKIVVNAVGDACPLPVVKATQAIREMTENGTLEVQVDNEIAVQNLTRLAGQKGFAVSSEKKEEKLYVVTMEVTVGEKAEDCGCTLMGDPNANIVAVFSSNAMGHGDDKLGTALMKGCIFAISQLETLPKTMLFYNGGAKLTTEGSDSLEDLKGLEAKGVEILTCGTCLNFYGLQDKLAVGSVTNMYSIVEKMAGASKIIKP